MTAPRSSNPFKRGLEAARANILPGIVLQVIAVSILLAYYFAPASRVVFDTVSGWKQTYGFAFSMVSTGIFGGAIPLLVARLSPSVRGTAQVAWRHLPYLTAFWALKGVEIDLLYRVQSALFGADPTTSGVVIKTLLDQFVYCVMWALPTSVIAYQFKEHGYSLKNLRPHLGPNFREWYRQHVLPVLVSNWGVWVPAVIVIYCLPEPLQLPIQNVILCLWAVLILWLTKHEPKSPDEAAEDEARRAIL